MYKDKLYHDLFVGQIVKKISGKPFKNMMKEDEVFFFAVNPQCPKHRVAAFIKNSETYVNLDMLESILNA